MVSKAVPEGGEKIPNDWEVKRLGDIALLEYGVSLKNSDRSGGVYPVYGSNGIVGFHNEPFVAGPGIVIGRKGSVGKVQFVKDSFCPIDTTYYVRVKYPQVLLEYLYRMMLMMRLDKMDSSSAVPGLNRNDVYTRHVPIPPLPEQRKIAAILSSVDEAIEKTKAVIEQTKVVKKGLMQELLTRGIPGRHKKFKKTSIGEIPEEWEVVVLGDHSNILSGGTPSTTNQKYWKGTIPWITSADILGLHEIIPKKFITKKAIKESATNLIPKDSIIVVTRVGLGKVAINRFDICISQDSQGVIPNKKVFPIEYLAYSLSIAAQNFITRNQGTAIKGILKEDLKSLKVPLPTFSEQQKIAGLLVSLDRRIEYNNKMLDELLIVKTALMQVLLSGEVRVKV